MGITENSWGLLRKRRVTRVAASGRLRPRPTARFRRLVLEHIEARTLLTAAPCNLRPTQQSLDEERALPDLLPNLAGEAAHPIMIVEPGPAPIGAAASDPHEEFQISSRWSTTALSGSGLGQGDATTLTWGFADDGTSVPGLNGGANLPSDLITFLDVIRGAGGGGSDLTQRPWFTLFAASFARMSALTGITYVYEPNDDGATFSSAARGIQGVRADIRIAGRFVDGQSGSNTLAFNFFPDHGDMVFDTGNVTFFSSLASNSVGFRNVVMHENGHGLGIRHVESDNGAFLMEPFINTSFDGPQLDDLLAMQREYGDAFEKGAGNNTTATAIDLGALSSGQAVSRGTLGNSTVVAATETDFLSIDDESDVDYFKFTASASTSASFNLTPRGATYLQAAVGNLQTNFNAAAQSDLTLQVIGANGTTVLATANATGVGSSEAITNLTLPAGGTYFVRVSGATLNKVQLYGLTVSLSSSTSLPGVSVTVDPASVIEDSSENLRYTFARTGSTAAELIVNVGVIGTATLGTDYTQSGALLLGDNSGSVIFPAGASTVTVIVDPTADLAPELNETVTFFIMPGSGYEPVTPTGVTGTIVNDEAGVLPAVTVTVANSSVFEDEATNAIFTFSRTGPMAEALSVNFSVFGLATLGQDYTQSGAQAFTNSAGVVTFAPGASTATITLDPLPDDKVEGSEEITLTLAEGPYLIDVPAAATAIIRDSDTAAAGFTLSVNSLFEDEGALLVEVGLNIDFELTLERPSSFAVFIGYLEADAADVVLQTELITFPAGSGFFTTQIVRVDATSDPLIEGPQQFTLGLQPISGPLLLGNEPEQTITIDDSDSGTVSFENLQTSIFENAPSANIRLVLHTAPGNTLEDAANVEVIASEETASQFDYNAEAFPAFVTFPAGAGNGSLGTVILDPRRDSIAEPDETTFLIIFDGELLTTEEPSIHEVIILDAAPPPPSTNVTTPEDTPVELFLGELGIAGAELSYDIIGPPGHGTLSGVAPDFLYRPVPNYNGLDSLIFLVTNELGDSALGTIAITIIPVNDQPTLVTPPDLVFSEDGSATLNLGALWSDVETPAAQALFSVQAASGVVWTLNPLNQTIEVRSLLPDFFGAGEITIRGLDRGDGPSLPLFAEIVVPVTIVPVNDVPLPTNDSLTSIAEDAQPRTIAVATLLSNDQPGPANEADQSLGVISVGGPVGGTVSLQGSSIVFTPAADFFGQARFTYTVQDNGFTAGNLDPKTATATVSFQITEVNDPPVAAPDVRVVAEDSAANVIAVLVNDLRGPQNEFSQTLSVIEATALHGTVTIAGDGTLRYTPELNYFGPDTINYTIRDNGTTNGASDPLTASNTVAITVTEVNDPPIGGADSLGSMLEDGPPHTISLAPLLINDIAGPANENSQSLSIVAVSGAVGGAANLGDNEIVFTVSPNYFGPASFTYTLRDNGTTAGVADPKTATVTVSFVITEVNDAPTAVLDTVVMLEDNAQTIAVLANDLAGPPNEIGQQLTVTQASALHGTVTVQADGKVAYRPDLDYFGPDTIIYTIVDNGTTVGLADPKASIGTVTITVREVNDAPVATSDSAVVAEDSVVVSIDVLANDTKGPFNEIGQTLAITAASALHGTVTITANGRLSYSPDPDYFGPDTISYTITDNGTTSGSPDPRSHSSTVAIVVTERNDAPLAVSDGLADLPEDAPPRTIALATLLANDQPGPGNEQGQTLTITSATAAIGGTIILQGSEIFFTPTPDYHGPAGFTYTLRDNGTTGGILDARQATATVAFVITEVNDPPVAAPDAAIVVEDSAENVVAVLGNDLPGPLNENSQSLIVTSATALHGAVTIAADGSMRYRPLPDYFGPDTISYTISDNGTTGGIADSKTSTSTVSVIVTEVNDAPSGASDALASSAEDGSPRTIALSALLSNDVPGPANESAQTLTISGVADPIGGAAILVGNQIVFTLAADYHGPAGFTYTLRDHGTTSGIADAKVASATVSFAITEVNDPPLAASDVLVVAEDSLDNGIAVLVNDLKGPANESSQTLSITASTALHGSVTIAADGTLRYSPEADYAGPDTITYSIIDNGTTSGSADSLSAQATVAVTVTEVNDVPLPEDDLLSAVAEDAPPRTISLATLLGNDQPGPSGEVQQEIAITSVQAVTGGTVSLVGTELVFTPTADFFGQAAFTYTIRDNGTTSSIPDPKNATATASFQISEVNDPPVASPQSVVVSEDSLDTIVSILAHLVPGPANESTQALQVTAASALHGQVTIAADGKLVYRPDADYFGSDTISYTVRDNGVTSAASDPQTVTASVAVTITEVNDAPLSAEDLLADILEDAAPLRIPLSALLANDAAGPANEIVQSLNVTNITAVIGGTVNLEGTELVFTLTPHFHGVAGFSYALVDNGTTNGTVDAKSATASARFTILAVNDAPSFVKGSDLRASDYESPIVVAGWAQSIAAGPTNELTQVVTFDIVGNTDPTLFESLPQIDPATGNLTFDPAANRQGLATLTVRLHDDGGTDHSGVDELLRTFTITVEKPLRWHNSLRALDAAGNGNLPDGVVTASDPLAVINYINAFGSGPIPAQPPNGFSLFGPPFLDMNADSAVTAGDALAAINWINAFGSGVPGPPGLRPAAAQDLLFAERESLLESSSPEAFDLMLLAMEQIVNNPSVSRRSIVC